jgi:hypothetical protein
LVGKAFSPSQASNTSKLHARSPGEVEGSSDAFGDAHFHLRSGVSHDRRWNDATRVVQTEQADGSVQLGLVNADHGRLVTLDPVVGLPLLLVHVVYSLAVPALDGFQDLGPHLVRDVRPLGGLALLVLVLVLVAVSALLVRGSTFSGGGLRGFLWRFRWRPVRLWGSWRQPLLAGQLAQLAPLM